VQRLVGPAGGVAAFALTAGLAADEGGFNPVSYDRALLVLCALALVAVVLGRPERPGVPAAAMLAALGLFAAWTAASWLWSESPPRALAEAPRVALYAVAAAAVVLAGRRIAPVWIAGGVAAAATLLAVWNLVLVIRGVDHPGNSGALAEPVGYANGVALLCVVGLVLLPMLPRLALLAALPLAADLVEQASTGAFAALAAALLTYAFMTRPRLRPIVAVAAVVALALSPFAFRGHLRGQYWRVAVHEAAANPVAGSGAGTFANWWLEERPSPLSTQEAHSLYLETLAELGPLGLALLLTALAVPLAAAVRTREPALAAALVAYDAAAAVDFHWELAGVTVPAVLLGASAVVRASRPGPRVPRAVLVPFFATLTAAALLAYAGAARLASAQDALRRGDRIGAVAKARSALRVAPFSAAAWGVIGDAESSPVAYRRALELDRNDWSLWARFADVSRGGPRRLALREAARLNPLASGS
jgi:O-Antigen ligase